MRKRYDVSIIGAGPVGTVAAIAHAKRGARVLLVEAKPNAAARFAGEWLHPPGVAALESLGVLPIEAAAEHGRGMVVFPDDCDEPIRLPYPDGATGLSFEHRALVEALRTRADAMEGVDYLSGTRAVQIEPGRLRLRSATDEDLAISTDRIVGAEGRNSISRSHLGLTNATRPLSHMAGVELRGVELPFEGYGHIILGGPGPILMYRVGPDRVRACLDLPIDRHPRSVNTALLWHSFRNVLPRSLVPAFRQALLDGRVMWTTTRVRPRSHYGRGEVALVGDAVGFFHPLTAAGMTLGFQDATILAASRDVEEYRRRRERQFFVAELLSTALYHVMSREDASTDSIRTAIYRMWGSSERERTRTMRMLINEDYRSMSFAAAFLRVALGAVTYLVQSNSHGDHRRRLTGLAGILSVPQTMLQWPAALLMRRIIRDPFSSWRRAPGSTPRLRLVTPSDPTERSGRTPAPNEVDVRIGLATALGALADSLEHPVGEQALEELPRILEALSQAHMHLHDGPDIATALTSGRRRLSESLCSPARIAEGVANRWLAEACLALLVDSKADNPSLDTLRGPLETMLDSQCASGGFPLPRGDRSRRWLGFERDARRADVATTALCCRALAAVRRRDGRFLVDRVPIALARARSWLTDQQTSAGCWLSGDRRPGVTLTANAMEALLLSGTPATARPLRRAGRWLRERQTESGTWTERDISPSPLTALVVRALIATRPLECNAIERGVNALLTPTGTAPGPTTRDLSVIGESLAAFLQWNGDVPGAGALPRRNLEA